MIDYLNELSPKRVFLIDGIGASVTSISYAAILAFFRPNFGFSLEMCLALFSMALIFACYSLVFAWINYGKWRSFLRIIAVANLLFCSVALGFMIWKFEKITILGKVYIVAESLLVTCIAMFELKYVNQRT